MTQPLEFGQFLTRVTLASLRLREELETTLAKRSISLTPQLRVTPQALHRSLQTLHKRHFVCRELRHGRRAIFYALTPEGLSALQHALTVVGELEAHLFDSVPHHHRAIALAVLKYGQDGANFDERLVTDPFMMLIRG